MNYELCKKTWIQKGFTFTSKMEGFTFIELIVSLAILLIVFLMITINISPLPGNATEVTAVDGIINDLRSQQTLAMADNSPYGIHLDTDSYTLFKGSSFVANAQGNFVVNLDAGVSITDVTIPDSAIIFSAGSGDVSGYVAGSDSLTISSSVTDKSTTIKINKYGATY